MGERIGNIAHLWRQPITMIAMVANNITADIELDEVNDENLKKYAVDIYIIITFRIFHGFRNRP